MTTMDFEAKARATFFALTNRHFPITNWDAEGDFATIAAALKEAWNEGIESVAAELEMDELDGMAALARSKKVP